MSRSFDGDEDSYNENDMTIVMFFLSRRDRNEALAFMTAGEEVAIQLIR